MLACGSIPVVILPNHDDRDYPLRIPSTFSRNSKLNEADQWRGPRTAVPSYRIAKMADCAAHEALIYQMPAFRQPI